MEAAQVKAEDDKNSAEQSFRNWAEGYVKDAKFMNTGSGTQIRQLLFSGAANIKPSKKGEYLERMYLLVGLAMIVWTSVGRFVEREKPKVRMRCRKKGARLSLVRIGILFFSEVKKTLRLTTKFVKENLPLPKVRIFSWLQVHQK